MMLFTPPCWLEPGSLSNRLAPVMSWACCRSLSTRALQQVQQDLAADGLGLKVWDAYRPLAVQQMMWDEIRDLRYVSDPAVNAGRHTHGTAVDVTLVDRRGNPLPMPSDFDDFSEAAHFDAPGIAPDRASNARRLREAMTRRGFQAFPTEWWHFDWKNWTSLPVVQPEDNRS